ncbi:MAG: hypothetical protein IPM52_03275 [Bacteroidetes bacterium]|nr:hypothetical protein [Bacteroidota bacterium]
MRSFIIAGVLIIWYVMQLMLQEKALRHVDGDGSGYYAYLTAVLIHRTTDLTPVLEAEKKRHSLDYMAHYFHKADQKLINKFYMGTALMMLPFFLAAWVFSWISGMPLDGYNIVFQYGVSLAAAFWLAIGLLATRRLLSLFGLPTKAILPSLAILVFGTNLFHYTFLQPSHSHVYSFAAIASFLTYTRLYFLHQQSRHFVLASVFFGLVLLIRPSNGLILFASAVVAGSADNLLSGIRYALSHVRMLLRGIAITLLIIGLQIIYNYPLTGRIFLWTYQNEGFNFLQPAFFQFLFSFRKGFFVYTPLMLLSLAGIVVVWKQNRWMAGSFILFFLLLVYILSSWWNWFYGDSFGMRAMVDFYSLLAIPMAMLVASLQERRILSLLIFPVIAVLVVLNLFQTWQYKAGIIHPDSMNAQKYRHVFLKWGEEYRNVLGAMAEPLFGNNLGGLIASYTNSMEHSRNPWTFNGIQPSDNAFSGSHVAQMNQSNIYSPTLVLQKDDILPTESDIYVKASVQYLEQEPNAALDALLVYAVADSSQQVVFYKTFRIKEMPDSITETWRTFETGFRVPAWDGKAAEIKVYIWNKERKQFQLDDFHINFYNINEK